MTGRGARALAGMLVVLTILAASARSGAAQDRADAVPEAKIWTGVYSPEQIELGKVSYTGICRRCHNDDLGGSERGPGLRGERFIANWEAQDLSRLLSKIRDTMPPDDPGGLPEDEYLGLISYVLEANGYPAGTSALQIADLESIQILGKEGLSEARNFSLVQVVGCLTPGPDESWILTRTSDPVLTGDRPSTPAELSRADAQPLGENTFRLVSVSPFAPESYRGHRVEAKGLVYRAPNKDRINVSSLQALGSTCVN